MKCARSEIFRGIGRQVFVASLTLSTAFFVASGAFADEGIRQMVPEVVRSLSKDLNQENLSAYVTELEQQVEPRLARISDHLNPAHPTPQDLKDQQSTAGYMGGEEKRALFAREGSTAVNELGDYTKLLEKALQLEIARDQEKAPVPNAAGVVGKLQASLNRFKAQLDQTKADSAKMPIIGRQIAHQATGSLDEVVAHGQADVSFFKQKWNVR